MSEAPDSKRPAAKTRTAAWFIFFVIPSITFRYPDGTIPRAWVKYTPCRTSVNRRLKPLSPQADGWGRIKRQAVWARRRYRRSALLRGPAVTRQQGLAIQPQVQSTRRFGIGLVALQPLPEKVVEVQRIDAIFGLEVHSIRGPRPVFGIVRWLWHRHAGRLRRQGQFRGVENRCGRGAKAPRARRRIEDVGHRSGERVIQVQRRQPQDRFNRAHKIEGVVLGGASWR